MAKPTIIELEKASKFATAIASYNKGMNDPPFHIPPSHLIKVSQVSKLGSDAFITLAKYEGFQDKDLKRVMEVAEELDGRVTFKQTGEINVSF
jgi:hypothetical protein